MVVILIGVVLLHTSDLDDRISFLLANWFHENLVWSSDDFVEGEFQRAYEVVVLKSLWVLEIIDIVYRYFENLLLLEFVWDFEVLYPLWV